MLKLNSTMKYIIPVLVIILSLFIFEKTPVYTAPNVWKIMTLGDSLTEGNYPNGINSYRGYLRAKLIANGFTNIDFVGDRSRQAHGDALPLDLNHAGHGGYTIGPDTQRFCPTCETTGLFEHIDSWLRASNPDIILLLIGMNDLVSSQNHPPNYAQTAPDRLEKLVQKIQQLRPNAKILLSSLLKTKTSTEGWFKYDAVNIKARKIGETNPVDNVYFVNLNAVNLVESDFWDNVHLKEGGARKVADGWYSALIPLLGGTLPPGTPVPTRTPTPTRSPTATPTPPSSALVCTGGCYGSQSNCNLNCSIPCARLTPATVIQYGCWSGAYRCCH